MLRCLMDTSVEEGSKCEYCCLYCDEKDDCEYYCPKAKECVSELDVINQGCEFAYEEE